MHTQNNISLEAWSMDSDDCLIFVWAV